MKKKIIGIILILLTLGALVFWEVWGRINLTYDKVLVLSKTVPENTIITKDMLREKKVDSKSSGALLVSDASKIVGLETVHKIPGGSELYLEYFEESKFVVGGNSNNYILSIPNDWLESIPQTLKRGDKAVFYSSGKFITESVVAYVRDGTNQEVDLNETRLESSANASLIEIVCTLDQAKELGELADQGLKFVVLYH